MSNPTFLAAPLKVIALTCFAASLGLTVPAFSAESPPGMTEADGTVHVPAFLLPESSLLNAATRAALKNERLAGLPGLLYTPVNCPKMDGADRAQVHKIRLCEAEAMYNLPFYTKLRERYPVILTPQIIGGVYTEVFTPADGISENNRNRVLINLHGGGFQVGSRTLSHVESVPVASVGKIKVVSVDYRQSPEYQFPAASEDVEAVYRELLKIYAAENIGIYGCSAGGVLTAQVVAWLRWKHLPPPGAVGMFCGSAEWWGDGDSGHFAAARDQVPVDKYANPQTNLYLQDVYPQDSLAFPGQSDETLEQFPPSLFITASRDIAFSSVVNTHARLVAYGIDAELHVWEGLGHAFFYNPDLPQSREAYDVIAKFFDRHLGTPFKRSTFDTNVPLETILSNQVEEFVKADQASPPVPCQVLFVGSSSIVEWTTLAQDMAPLPVINRGFGGSHIEYVNRWFNEVVAPYHPRAIAFYAGDNDVAAGKSVERVVADFDEFMKKKRAALGWTPVYFISIKPSKLRWWQLHVQTDINEAIRKRTKSEADLHYIDVASPMLDHGRPKDIFVTDHLHMSPQGYAIWTRAVRGALLPHAQAELQRCQRNDHH